MVDAFILNSDATKTTGGSINIAGTNAVHTTGGAVDVAIASLIAKGCTPIMVN
jgi:hypothetical protein